MKRCLALAFVLTLALAGVAPAWIAPPGDSIGQGDSPHVVMDAQRNALFVFTGTVPGGGDPNQIQARRLTPAGTLGPLLRLTDPTNVSSDFSRNPQVALDAGGTAHVVWSHDGHGIETRTVSPGGTLGATLTVSSAGGDPQLAVDGAGRTHFVWDNGAKVQTRTLLANGTFSAATATDVSTSTTDTVLSPKVAVDSAGDATFVWSAGISPGTVDVRRLNADLTTFPAAVKPASDADDAFGGQVAVDTTGLAHVAWLGCADCSNDNQVATTRTVDSSGNLGTRHDLSDSSDNAFGPVLVPNRGGQVAAGWLDRVGSDNIGMLSSVGSGSPTPAVQVTRDNESVNDMALAVDAANATLVAWRVDGDMLARRVPAAGVPGAIATLATDATALDEPEAAAGPSGHAAAIWNTLGFRLQGSIDPTPPPIKTTPKPPPTKTPTTPAKPKPKPPPVKPAKDTKAPKLSGLKLSPKSFRAAGKGAALASAAKKKTKKKPKPGSKLTYALSEKATVTFHVVAKKSGRKVEGKCRKRTHANRKKPKCDRQLAGSVKDKGVKGVDALKFSGRWRGHKLAPGRYALVAVAKDAAGNAGRAHRVGFRIKQS